MYLSVTVVAQNKMSLGEAVSNINKALKKGIGNKRKKNKIHQNVPKRCFERTERNRNRNI